MTAHGLSINGHRTETKISLSKASLCASVLLLLILMGSMAEAHAADDHVKLLINDGEALKDFTVTIAGGPSDRGRGAQLQVR